MPALSVADRLPTFRCHPFASGMTGARSVPGIKPSLQLCGVGGLRAALRKRRSEVEVHDIVAVVAQGCWRVLVANGARPLLEALSYSGFIRHGWLSFALPDSKSLERPIPSLCALTATASVLELFIPARAASLLREFEHVP